MYKQAFEDYLNATNVEGSGKVASYLRAFDLLALMLQAESFGFDDCLDIWRVGSPQRIKELYDVAQREKQHFHSSAWNIDGVPKSYLERGFCSAALKAYASFLSTVTFEDCIFEAFERYQDEEALLPEVLEQEVTKNESLLDIPSQEEQEGQDVLRTVKARANHHVFSRIVRSIYNKTCCITGLNIPELNRASHIIPWSENSQIRLDPRNGLFLSATYDAAFDRHLISLDDDYRIILSGSLNDYMTNDSVKDYFESREGQVITLPNRYRPSLEYLTAHRSNGEF